MKRTELALLLKGLAIIAGGMALVLCGPVAASIGERIAQQNPEFRFLFWPCLIFLWITAVPFYVALGYAWKIFNEIAGNHSFCLQNALRLKRISVLALIDTLLYVGVVIVLLAVQILHPGILLLVLIIMMVGAAVSAASAALSHLVEKKAKRDALKKGSRDQSV